MAYFSFICKKEFHPLNPLEKKRYEFSYRFNLPSCDDRPKHSTHLFDSKYRYPDDFLIIIIEL